MNNSLKTKVKALIWVILGLSLILIAFALDSIFDKCNTIVIVAKNILSAFGTICLFSFAWEIINKSVFAKEVLDLAKVSENYIQSGIKYVYNDFDRIEWDKLFKNAKEVEIFFAYGYSWRNSNRTAIQMLKNQGTKVTIILPNYNNDEITDYLNKEFGYDKYAEENSPDSEIDVKNSIQKTKVEFEKIGATVILYNGKIKSSYYMIDDRCIFVPFKHMKEKEARVPAFLCEAEGILFDYCKRDLAAIKNDCSL